MIFFFRHNTIVHLGCHIKSVTSKCPINKCQININYCHNLFIGEIASTLQKVDLVKSFIEIASVLYCGFQRCPLLIDHWTHYLHFLFSHQSQRLQNEMVVTFDLKLVSLWKLFNWRLFKKFDFFMILRIREIVPK